MKHLLNNRSTDSLTLAVISLGCLTALYGCGGSGSTQSSPQPPTANLTFSSSATTISNGGTITLTWVGTEVSNCVANGDWAGQKPNSGSENVGPLTSNSNFTIACDSSVGSLSRSVNVTINSGNPATDPQLAYATYFGGTANETIRDVAVGPDGSVYIAGGSESGNFPTQNAYDATFNGNHDVVVSKFTPGGALVWSTFIGGTNYDRAYALEVDGSGNVYVAGRAGAGYPTTAGVVQPNFSGDTSPNPAYGPQDGFVSKFNSAGQLQWSTFLGGNDLAFIRDIAIDASGNVYFAISQVSSTDNSVAHLITAGSFQTTHAGGTDGIVGKLRSDGRAIEWGTFLGGSSDDYTNPSIRLDQQGNVLVTGATDSSDMPVTSGFGTSLGGQIDMHLTKLLPDGSDIVYGTYIGGSGIDATETHCLAVDSSGNAYVAAATSSADFPTTSGALQRTHGGGWDAFLTKVSPQGALLASSLFGGSGDEAIEGVSIGPDGDFYVSGETGSSDFPVTSNAIQTQHGGVTDIFAARLSSNLSSLVYGTFVGGSTYDLGRSSWVDGNVFHIVGHSNSNNFPATNNAHDTTLNGSPNTGSKFSGDGVLVHIEFP